MRKARSGVSLFGAANEGAEIADTPAPSLCGGLDFGKLRIVFEIFSERAGRHVEHNPSHLVRNDLIVPELVKVLN
jgi:hypothetical protein